LDNPGRPGKVEPMPGEEPGRTLWRHRDFLLLWSGQTVSETGSAVTQLALPLTATSQKKARKKAQETAEETAQKKARRKARKKA
jgi:hypothetical protein